MLVTPSNFDQAMEELADSYHLFCDTETSGLEIFKDDRVIGVAVEAETHNGIGTYYFTFGHAEYYIQHSDGKTEAVDVRQLDELGDKVRHSPNLSYTEHMPKLLDILYDPKRKTYWWNASFDMSALYRERQEVPDNCYDIMLMAHLVDENASSVRDKLGGKFKPSFKLKEQGLLVDPNAAEAEKELKKVIKKGNMAAAPAEVVYKYAEQDVTLTRLLLEEYITPLTRNNLMHLWLKVNRYMRVLVNMSIRGIKVDPQMVLEHAQECEWHIEKITTEIQDLVGYKINLNSPAQICEVLEYPSSARDVLEHFVKHGWNWKKEQVVDESGEVITDTDGNPKIRRKKHKLDDKQKRVAELLLQHRAWSKMLSTYYRPYLDKKDHGNVIHPSFSLHGTVSGRLSSSNPNLQQVPRQSDKAKVKDVFLPRKGFCFVECDYRQAELRVGAHLAKEVKMLETLRDDLDIHDETAQELGIDRVAAKRINFGIIYGLGAKSLAKYLDVSEAEAKKYLKNYHELRPNFKTLYDIMQATATDVGQIEMWTGRIRHYDYLTPTYKAIAHLVQGSTAEVMRVALTKLGEEMPAKDVYPLIQVHDSVLFEVPLNEYGRPYPELLADIKNCMEFRDWKPEDEGVDSEIRQISFKGDHNFFVPMRIDMKWGFTWGDMPNKEETWIEPDNEDRVYHPDEKEALRYTA